MIKSFSGPYTFLSNFHLSKVCLDGRYYPTVEHAYQAAKTLFPGERAEIESALTPGLAKRLGRATTIREDWKDIRLAVMENLLRQKFANPALRAQLTATSPQHLVEGNWWGDTFWGVYKGVGKNELGKLLMKIREEA